MDKNKKFITIYCCIVLVATIGLAFLTYQFGQQYNIYSRASSLLNREIATFRAKNTSSESEKKMLENQLKSLENQISEKSSINKDLEVSIKETDQTRIDIQSAKEKLSQLDSQLNDKQTEYNNLKSVSITNKTTKASLKEGTYECPKNISPGRYTVIGGNTMLVYTSSGSLRISANLEKLDSNSFTLDIESGEKIRIVSNSVSPQDNDN